MRNPQPFDPHSSSHHTWWPKYQSLLQHFFAEDFYKLEEQITHLLGSDDGETDPDDPSESSSLFYFALFRLWLESLHIQLQSHRHHREDITAILDELSRCLRTISAEKNAPLAYKALYALCDLYRGCDKEARNKVSEYLDQLKEGKEAARREAPYEDPYHEELRYKIEIHDAERHSEQERGADQGQTIKNKKKNKKKNKSEKSAPLPLPLPLPFSSWIGEHSGDAAPPKHGLLTPLYDYCHLQTITAAYMNPLVSGSIYDLYARETLSQYVNHLFPKSPWNTWIQAYKALDQGQLDEALSKSLELSLAYPHNSTFRALVHRIQSKTSHPNLWLSHEMRLLEAARDRGDTETTLSLFSKVCSVYLRLQSQKDFSLPKEIEDKFRHNVEATLELYHLNIQETRSQRRSDQKKAWLCYLSNKDYLQMEDRGLEDHRAIEVSLQHPAQKSDLVYAVRKSINSARLVGIYEIKATLPGIFGLEKNTVLEPLYVFAHAHHHPSIKLPLEETDRSDNSDLIRSFGAELSFELAPQAHTTLINEINDQVMLDPHLISSLQQQWDTLA